jgi:NAD(P)-dependent dehydrogenase (short-subunit alcohol dehydrogenase family)
MDLQGQRVVILGGTSGIGLATAKAAARGGAEVTVISRQPASIDRALAELPPGARGRAADLTDPGPQPTSQARSARSRAPAAEATGTEPDSAGPGHTSTTTERTDR